MVGNDTQAPPGGRHDYLQAGELFSSELPQRGRPHAQAQEQLDLSRLPARVAAVIRETKFTPAEHNQAYAAALRQVALRYQENFMKHDQLIALLDEFISHAERLFIMLDDISLQLEAAHGKRS